jgi:hypothetical protein
MRRPDSAFGHLAATLVFLLFFALPAPATATEVVEINAHQLKNLMDNDDILVAFPLSLIEFNHMHIEGSIHIPLEDLKQQLPADKSHKVAFYCLGRT